MTGPTARTPISHSPVASGTNVPTTSAENSLNVDARPPADRSQYHDSRPTAAVAVAPDGSANVAVKSPRTVGR